MKRRTTTIVSGTMLLAAAVAWSAPEDRFGGGSFDGWDRCVMANSTGLGGVQVSLSSGTPQTFDFTATPVLATLTIEAEVPAGTITNGGTMRLTVPAAWACRFDTGASVTLGGDAAGKVGAASYTDGGRTLSVGVTDDFDAGDTLTIAGLRLADLRLVAPGTAHLELDYTGDGALDVYDQYALTVSVTAWPGGSYDGWDRQVTAEYASLTPLPKGALFLFR